MSQSGGRSTGGALDGEGARHEKGGDVDRVTAKPVVRRNRQTSEGLPAFLLTDADPSFSGRIPPTEAVPCHCDGDDDVASHRRWWPLRSFSRYGESPSRLSWTNRPAECARNMKRLHRPTKPERLFA